MLTEGRRKKREGGRQSFILLFLFHLFPNKLISNDNIYKIPDSRYGAKNERTQRGKQIPEHRSANKSNHKWLNRNLNTRRRRFENQMMKTVGRFTSQWQHRKAFFNCNELHVGTFIYRLEFCIAE